MLSGFPMGESTCLRISGNSIQTKKNEFWKFASQRLYDESENWNATGNGSVVPKNIVMRKHMRILLLCNVYVPCAVCKCIRVASIIFIIGATFVRIPIRAIYLFHFICSLSLKLFFVMGKWYAIQILIFVFFCFFYFFISSSTTTSYSMAIMYDNDGNFN